ncbi:MAG: RseA family anti-sigma factor [Neisseria sp.]|nr:RseA family anti-sigma factor [Neisseria sp.]
MDKQDKDFEFVSAVMDDDGLSEETLDALLSDADAQQKWYEYHLIRDYLQHAKPIVGKDIKMSETGFSASLAQVAAENKQRYGSKTRQGGHTANAANHAFMRFAAVASVLAVAVATWQLWPQTSAHEAGMAAAEQAAPARQADSAIVSVGGNAAAVQADIAPKKDVVVPNAALVSVPPAAESQSAVRVEKRADAEQADIKTASAAQTVQ